MVAGAVTALVFAQTAKLSTAKQISANIAILSNQLPLTPEPRNDTTFISSTYARALFRAVADQGYDPALILTDEIIEVDAVSSSAQLDAAVFGRMYQRAIKLLNDESLGMASGCASPVGTFRMMCLCVIHRPCLAAIVRRSGEFLDICMPAGLKPCLSEEADSIGIGFATVARESGSVEALLADKTAVSIRTTLYLWHSLLNWFAGRYLPIQEVNFHFDEPERGQQWQSIFHCPVNFNKSRSMICFAPGALDAPNIQTERTLSVFLKSAPYRLIVPSFHDQRLGDRVLAIFGDDLTQALPGTHEVSRHLGISVSTLRRQLSEEGTSFQQLKDDHRQAAALQYLGSAELSLSDVSVLLGFIETSAFFRAFKRWTGQTPSEYRAHL